MRRAGSGLCSVNRNNCAARSADAGARIYLAQVFLRKTRLSLQQRFQFGAYARLVQYPEPLLHDFAVSANQNVLRLRGNAQFTPNAVLPVVIQIKKHKLDSIAEGLF